MAKKKAKKKKQGRYEWHSIATKGKKPLPKASVFVRVVDGLKVATAKTVVNKARATSSPIHKMFEWDNRVAGEEYRLEQARLYLRCIRVKIIGDKSEARTVYVHVSEEANQNLYVRAEVVAENERYRAFAMKECMGLLTGLRKRFAFLSELKSIWNAIDDLEIE